MAISARSLHCESFWGPSVGGAHPPTPRRESHVPASTVGSTGQRTAVLLAAAATCFLVAAATTMW